MKRKIELVCWILFTLCSGICFFINFMSKPPVDDTHKFTLYMIGAATVSLKGRDGNCQIYTDFKTIRIRIYSL